jgi:arylsulfatase A-like enzyme/uncharacterized membrane protein YhaH (DUF805 family)
MKFRVWRAVSPATPVGALVMLFMTFPGLFLPLDVVYSFPGVMTYAAPDQAARIFLYLVALSVVMSALSCMGCIAVGALAGGTRRHRAGRTAYCALWLCLTLVAFALGHGLLVWSSYFIEYSPELRWLRMLTIFALSVPAGLVLVRRLPEKHLGGVHAVLRASTVVVAVSSLMCGGLLLLGPKEGLARSSQVPAAGDRPSIFLITVDTLSAMHLPMYGYGRPTAPRLSEFAEGANVFLRNYANSNFTTPSVASMLTGRRPWTHRAIQLEGRPLARLTGESLPGILEASGYFAASVSTNPWASPRHLAIDDRFSALAEHKICAASNPVYVLEPDLQVAVSVSLVWDAFASFVIRASDVLGLCEHGHFDPELAFSEVRRILASAPPGRPVFMWIHLYPPHDPYVAPEPFVGKFAPSPKARDRSSTIPPYFFEALFRLDFPGLLMDRYDEAIRYVDHHVGAFLDELRRTGRYDKSLVVVTADHGESFTKGYANHGGPMLHEELIRVPLLVKAPGQTEGRRITELSEQVDLKPTILELAGIRSPHSGDGISLVPATHGRSLDRPVFSMNFQQSSRLGTLDTGTLAMMDGRWKYVHYFGAIRYPHLPQLKDELYDLSTDPWETQNQMPARPDVAAKMKRVIETRLAQHGGRVE